MSDDTIDTFATPNYGTTPNYGFKKPVTNSDDDLWGTHWNENADALDSLIKTIDTKPPVVTAPGGTTTQVQFNDAGAFGGDAGLTYDKNTDTLQPGNIKVTQGGKITEPVEVTLQSTGGTYGSSILRIKNEPGVNGAMFEVQPQAGIDLCDFVFKTPAAQSNIRFECRPANLMSGNSWEFQIGSAPGGQFVVGSQFHQALKPLSLNADPTQAMHAATKQYVDNNFVTQSAGDARWINTSGDTMTGPLALAGDPTTPPQAATKQYVDAKTWAYAALPAAVRQAPVAFPFAGKPGAAARVNVPIVMPITIAASLAGSAAYATTAATAAATFTINKVASGGAVTALGTVVVNPTGGPTLSGAGGNLAVGDTLQCLAPGTQDATLADVGLTIMATRT